MAKNENVEIIGLGDLKPGAQNARRHTARNVAMVVDALQEVGAARSIVIDGKASFLPETPRHQRPLRRQAPPARRERNRCRATNEFDRAEKAAGSMW